MGADDPPASPVGLSHRRGAEYRVKARTRAGGAHKPRGTAFAARSLDLVFAGLAENTTCCGLLKQPDNQKLTTDGRARELASRIDFRIRDVDCLYFAQNPSGIEGTLEIGRLRGRPRNEANCRVPNVPQLSIRVCLAECQTIDANPDAGLYVSNMEPPRFSEPSKLPHPGIGTSFPSKRTATRARAHHAIESRSPPENTR